MLQFLGRFLYPGRVAKFVRLQHTRAFKSLLLSKMQKGAQLGAQKRTKSELKTGYVDKKS